MLRGRAKEGIGACGGGVEVLPPVRPVDVLVVVREGPELGGLRNDVFDGEVFVLFGFEDVNFGCAAATASSGSGMVLAGASTGATVALA